MKIRNIEVSAVKGDIKTRAVPAVLDAADEELRKGSVDEHRVRAAIRKALVCAEELKLASVLLPAIGYGVNGFPLVGSAKIAAQEALRAGREARKDAPLKEIVFCLKDEEELAAFEKQVNGYLRHVIEDLSWGPYVTTDIIIEVSGGIVIIERTNPPFGWALPGGFVDRGESLETAAAREAMEETGLKLEDLKQFHTYSDPARDPRFHTVTAVFTAKGVGVPTAGDDAKGLQVVPFNKLRSLKYAFDHHAVIDEYLESRGM